MAALAYSYIRFSTPEQKKGRSYERQLDKAIKYCAANKLTLDNKLKMYDEGISAFRGKNKRVGALADFLSKIESGYIKKGSYLIIENLDRLSRQDLDTAQELFRNILKNGVNIVTVADNRLYTPASLNDPWAIVGAIIIMARAHEESQTKSERLLDAWEAKRKNLRTDKKFFTKVIPFWLSWDKEAKTFKLIPERVAVIHRIFEMAKNGYGKTKITKILNQERVPSFKKKTWGTSSVQRILSNRELIGEYQPHRIIDEKRVPDGDPVVDYFPKAIDEELFYLVQGRRENPIVKGNQKKISSLFTGIIKCADCKASMAYVDKGSNWQYLVCYKAKVGAGCEYRSIRYDDFEKSFFRFCFELDVKELINDENNQNIQTAITELSDRIKSQTHKRNETRNRIQKLMLAFIDSSSEEMKANLNKVLSDLTIETETLSAQIKKWESELLQKKAYYKSVANQFDSIKSYYEKAKELNESQLYSLRCKIRTAIRDLVESIEVLGNHYTILFKNGMFRSVGMRGENDSISITMKPLSQVKKRA